ncbi:hypothetical protein [Methyloversatilis sp.]|uniref:hypothetical protein n=1 Tax=Methyloversatilis sp. TaxID=2569862 RepID=UPI0027356E8A|nr:hypothetical protein [Methyloversatilis sp.]MDP3579152.1 hypothetical protein [Methyloversatilis sp.]
MSNNALPPTNTFLIEFDSKNSAGYIKGVKVTIEADIVDVDESVRIDLADHPLYRALQRYVLNNPR